MRFARLALPVLLLSTTVVTVPASANSLLPHRAVYDLALDDASDRSGITGISGRMVYEFNGSSCEGYTVTFRFVTQIQTSDVARLTDQQTTTFEGGDGETFSFVTRSFVDDQLSKELRGNARLEPDETLVDIEEPERQEISLEATQFPTQHLLELLDKARAGETFYETTLFDGSEDADKVMTTSVVIGRPSTPTANDAEAEAIGPLKQDRYWPVDVAYFDLTTGEETPTYRISFKLHENGVTRDLVMDYGDFSMSGTLVDLSMFDVTDTCAQ
ncbi:cell envelope integrity EipB family protein [Mesorhizobium sp. CAU 1741]|uniref:cell envelope integrity EipB family protein n=1 Tax=Mesorhizobium sp. CAU 1741 TaxID=3140366 RepID=UPI00325ACEDE